MGSLSIEVPVTVEMEDLDELSDEDLQALEDDIRENMDFVGANMQNIAQSLAPVRTGTLLASIWYRVFSGAMVITLGASASYASYVEYGTYKMMPRPFLTPATEAGEEEINARVEEAIISRLDGKLDSSEEGDNVTMELEGSTGRFEGGIFGALEKLE